MPAFQLEIPGGVRRTNPGPVDVYYTPNGARRGYTSLGQACSFVPAGVRSDGLTVLVNGVEYWWLNGEYADTQLLIKYTNRSPVTPFDGAAITRWEPRTYNDDPVVVLHNSTLYELTAELLPFDSVAIEDELQFGQWTPICCDSVGPPIDPTAYLLAEDGRRILDQSGQPITVL